MAKGRAAKCALCGSPDHVQCDCPLHASTQSAPCRRTPTLRPRHLQLGYQAHLRAAAHLAPLLRTGAGPSMQRTPAGLMAFASSQRDTAGGLMGYARTRALSAGQPGSSSSHAADGRSRSPTVGVAYSGAI